MSAASRRASGAGGGGFFGEVDPLPASWGHGAWERARDRILRILAIGYPDFKLSADGSFRASLLEGDALFNGR